MKLTESKLKQIIAEELQKVLVEQDQSMPGGISGNDRVYGMSAGVEGADVTADLKGLTARQTLRKLSRLYGGVKGIRKLPRNDPDRIAYRKAFKAMRAARRREMPEPELTGRKKARAVEPVTDPRIAARKAAAERKAERDKELAAVQARRKEFEKQQAMDQATVYTQPSAAAGFKTPPLPTKPIDRAGSRFGTVDPEFPPVRRRKRQTTTPDDVTRGVAGALTGTPRE